MAARNKGRFPFLILFPAMALAAGPVLACSVPVFRYALERWEPGQYVLMVFHRGPMAPADKEPVELITKGSLDGGGSANIWVRTIDVSADMEEFENAIWSAQDDPALPWAVLLYPPKRMAPPGPAVWRGRLTKDMTKAILDSPARQEIARRLQAGDSAVWTLLENDPPKKEPRTNWLVAGPAIAAVLALLALFAWSVASRRYVLCGTALVLLVAGLAVLRVHHGRLTIEPEVKPSAALTRLEAALKKVQKELVLPEMDPYDAQWGPGGTPIQDLQKNLKISFSVIRVSRSDPAEEMLVRMLMRSEPDLETEHADKPMAFAVFGRGRVLHALVGDGITAENVTQDGQFLTDPCSCEVKDLNPGTDLLISAAWVTNQPLVEEFQLPPLPDLSKDVTPDEVVSAPGMTPVAPIDTRLPPPPARATTAPAADARQALIQKVVILGAVIIAITIALAVYVRRQSLGN
ncbi:MAG: hypothetical protein ABIF82_04525 [Planctomycetota bacterium]